MTEPFVARRRWQRVLFRWWRTTVVCRMPGRDRHGLERRGYRYIVPPREWSQEQADAAIKRGQDLARKYDW